MTTTIAFETLPLLGNIAVGDYIAVERVLNTPARVQFAVAIVNDLSPTLGSNLDLNNYHFNDINGNTMLFFNTTASAVNHVALTNATTGNAPTYSIHGTDTNINANIQPKGTGYLNVISGNLTSPLQLVSGTSGQHTSIFSFSNTAASDTYTFPDATGTIALFDLAHGGTNNNLTASNGGVVYSDASKFNILAGTATAQQLLTSGSSSAPVWTTSTYPLTNAINTLLYASSANTMAALATANSSGLLTNGSGVPAWVAFTGSGSPVLATSPTLVTPLLGTPTSGTLTNCTGLPISSGVSGLGTGVATWLASPTAANLLSAVTANTGTVNLVFSNSPTLVTPALGTPASGILTSCTGLPVSSGISGLGTGVATALAAGVSGSGNLVLVTSATLVTPTLGAALATSIEISNTGLIDTNGNVALAFSATGSAVNGFTLVNAATANNPVLEATGSDTNIRAIFKGKGNLGCGIQGTTAADNAAAGNVGELIQATGNAVAITANINTNVTSVSLTAGDWTITGYALSNPAGTTVSSFMYAGFSTTSATFGTTYTVEGARTGGISCGCAVPSLMISVSSTTTVYLVVDLAYSVSTCTINGNIYARRAR